MSESSFNISGLEELEKDLTKAIRKCPEQAKETLNGIANEFKKSAKKRAKAELKPHAREGDKKNAAIDKKWGKRVIDESVGMTALVWNSARHFHLVEDGHNLVIDGKQVGFVPGKHIMEKTRNEYRDKIPEEFEKMVDDILEENNL